MSESISCGVSFIEGQAHDKGSEELSQGGSLSVAQLPWLALALVSVDSLVEEAGTFGKKQ